ncbi:MULTISPECIES: hypothetical protein [Bradyrhizobium]|uniref:hypothetical protein n=1 Tax=Bradyrhizobium TaxID=374 RepID=UPI00155ECA0B|nr:MULTISPECIES: hypothetical protein [Bradyrhizobium]MDD1520689.1 hypothetical protein [Bradyrhizobium sp. WBAH30]MDD1545741.1 hypothetical protein [Bradyrhizobium sp. WBAH41]MDD1558998.1 hypothetical protein [Bradyrhizobium sp. WBAH23]MDD1566351.1 hypothetical protein [Bradyrhizobium sp. WBAH33]MDD1591945.1 hypothetical protein [Bradyrhizobium sp. WBAH42]
MITLLADAIDAHGGLARWKAHAGLAGTIVTGGELWALKGINQDQNPRTMQVDLHRQWASVEPFGATGQRTDFMPNRIAIVANDGRIVAERTNPRASFAGHDMRTTWDPLHRAYFNGYALWTYLTTPFLLAMDGFEIREIEPWSEGADKWRGLRATFPATIASHSTEQDFYFGPDMLIRRHDYRVDVAGGFPAAQYVSNPMNVDGIMIPTKRRVFLRNGGSRPHLDTSLVTIDLSHFRFR